LLVLLTAKCAAHVDEALLNFYVEYVLECIATDRSPLAQDDFRALLFAMLEVHG